MNEELDSDFREWTATEVVEKMFNKVLSLILILWQMSYHRSQYITTNMSDIELTKWVLNAAQTKSKIEHFVFQ